MRKTLRTIGIASLFIGGLAATSPLLAHKAPKPSTGTMMQGGGMDGMMGMMSMMEQMNKMMGLCTKMMEASIQGTGGHDMQMPQPTPEAPKQGG